VLWCEGCSRAGALYRARACGLQYVLHCTGVVLFLSFGVR